LGTTPTKNATARTPDFINPQLTAAMSHPTRIHTMSVLLERTASPRQVAEEIGERLNNVTYHVNQLRKLGCVELVRTERVRGGRVLEHFYRATQRLYIDEDAWQGLEEKDRLTILAVTLRMISEDITSSIAAGAFFAEGDAHLYRQPISVDAEGWREISEVLERTGEELMQVEGRIAERVAAGGPADIPANVQLMQFRGAPPPTPQSGEGTAED
jgi:DNA-binding transcriptional ArsR family regulator